MFNLDDRHSGLTGGALGAKCRWANVEVGCKLPSVSSTSSSGTSSSTTKLAWLELGVKHFLKLKFVFEIFYPLMYKVISNLVACQVFLFCSFWLSRYKCTVMAKKRKAVTIPFHVFEHDCILS